MTYEELLEMTTNNPKCCTGKCSGKKSPINKHVDVNEDNETPFSASKPCSGSGNTCNQFAKILGGTVIASRNGLCVVQRIRNIKATILGRPTHSPLALAALFSFEDMDTEGNTLNLGETVILQEEINPFISILRQENIKVTALHNHWLFDNPRLMFIHFESIENPLVFARKVAKAFEVLGNNCN